MHLCIFMCIYVHGPKFYCFTNFISLQFPSLSNFILRQILQLVYHKIYKKSNYVVANSDYKNFGSSGAELESFFFTASTLYFALALLQLLSYI